MVYVALAANLAISVVKFTAGALTSSSAMTSEGVHSLVDSINELLLLYGIRRAGKPPDLSHPFGYGRELYFWSFIVALLVLALGAGVSLYEGVAHLRNPEPMRNPIINYAVIAASFAFEGASWFISLRAFGKAKGDLGYFAAFRVSKDPTTFTVLLEDSAAVIGLLIAAAGIAAAQLLNMPAFDGIASLGIGLVLVASSMLLARETKGLLIGESAHPHVRDSIVSIAAADPDLRIANGVLTVQMGPNQVVAALSAEFHDALNTTQIEQCVNRLEAAIKQAHPEVTALFVKPQTAEGWRRRIASLGAREPP
ncbi:MAG: cation diffusion facilitator family transporter [Gammaproteobacteria bacterium]